MTRELPFDGGNTAEATGAHSPRATPPTPVAIYDQLRALNWSTLKHMHVSPRLYRWRLTKPEPQKTTFVVGSAIHCAILEPGKFDARYAVYDGIRKGKAWDQWQEEHPGVQSLKPDELERVLAVAASVREHRVADQLLRGGRCEETVTWTDPETGLACKGRLDYIRPDFVVDLKSARDVRPRKFQWHSEEYLYDAQVAFYHDGATVAGLLDGKAPPWVIALESDEPYDVACFQLEQQALDEGRGLYRSLMRRLLQCEASGLWPGVAPDPEVLYARRKQEQYASEEEF